MPVSPLVTDGLRDTYSIEPGGAGCEEWDDIAGAGGRGAEVRSRTDRTHTDGLIFRDPLPFSVLW